MQHRWIATSERDAVGRFILTQLRCSACGLHLEMGKLRPDNAGNLEPTYSTLVAYLDSLACGEFSDAPLPGWIAKRWVEAGPARAVPAEGAGVEVNMPEQEAGVAESGGAELKMTLAQVTKSTFVPGTWIVVVQFPESHRIGDYETKEAAVTAAVTWCDRAFAVLKRARSLK